MSIKTAVSGHKMVSALCLLCCLSACNLDLTDGNSRVVQSVGAVDTNTDSSVTSAGNSSTSGTGNSSTTSSGDTGTSGTTNNSNAQTAPPEPSVLQVDISTRSAIGDTAYIGFENNTLQRKQIQDPSTSTEWLFSMKKTGLTLNTNAQVTATLAVKQASFYNEANGFGNDSVFLNAIPEMEGKLAWEKAPNTVAEAEKFTYINTLSATGSAFSGNSDKWYYYYFGEHKILPNFRVYVIKVGNDNPKYYNFQVLGYYKDENRTVSRHPTLKIQAID